MLTAKVGNQIINTIDNLDSDIRKWSDKGIIKCPYCGNQMVYRNGKIRVPHFCHVHKCNAKYNYSEPETEEHLLGKKALYQWLQKQDGIKNLQIESWLPETHQRSDIYFEQNGKRYVVEYQCSPISSEYLERHKLYQLAGVNDIWILGTEKYKNSHRFIETQSQIYLDSHTKTLKIDRDIIWDILEEKLFKKYKLDLFYTFDLQDIFFDNYIKLSENAKKPFIIMNNNEKIREKNKIVKNETKLKNNEIPYYKKKEICFNFIKGNQYKFREILGAPFYVHLSISYSLKIVLSIIGCNGFYKKRLVYGIDELQNVNKFICGLKHSEIYNNIMSIYNKYKNSLIYKSVKINENGDVSVFGINVNDKTDKQIYSIASNKLYNELFDSLDNNENEYMFDIDYDKSKITEDNLIILISYSFNENYKIRYEVMINNKNIVVNKNNFANVNDFMDYLQLQADNFYFNVENCNINKKGVYNGYEMH